MWTSGRGFGKVGALFAGIECVIESVSAQPLQPPLVAHAVFQYRAKNDIYNSVGSGFLAGGVLARNSGPKAAFGGGLAFAAFSAAIDLLFLRRETPECVLLWATGTWLLLTASTSGRTEPGQTLHVDLIYSRQIHTASLSCSCNFLIASTHSTSPIHSLHILAQNDHRTTGLGSKCQRYVLHAAL